MQRINILKNYFKYYVLFLVMMVTLLLSINLAQALTDQPSNTSTTKTQSSASDTGQTHTVPTKIQESILIPGLRINLLPSNTNTTSNTSTTSVPPSVNSKSTNSLSPTGSSVGTSTSVPTSISRSAEQSKAFTQWLKTSCADRLGQGSKNECYKDRINDVANLNHTINVAISKEQAYCSKLSAGQKKTECDNSVFKTVAKNSQAYLGTPSNSFIQNKKKLDESKKVKTEIDRLDKEEREETKKCQGSIPCLKKLKDYTLERCMAKKVITSMDRGDKYDPTKYAPVGPIQAKDMGPYISKAKAAIKKDCMEEKKKKSKTAGQVSS